MIMGIITLFIILLPILIILIGYHIDRENNKINVQTSNSDHNNISHMITTSNTSAYAENNNTNNEAIISKSDTHSNTSLISTGSTSVENNNTNNDSVYVPCIKGRYFINHYKESDIQYSYVARRLVLDILHVLDKSEHCYFAIDVTGGIEFECENIFIPLARAGLIYYKKITTPIEQDEYGFIKCDERRYILVGITSDARKFVSNTTDD